MREKGSKTRTMYSRLPSSKKKKTQTKKEGGMCGSLPLVGTRDVRAVVLCCQHRRVQLPDAVGTCLL